MNIPSTPPAISQADDEIDIGRLASVVWAGKYWIILSIALALAIGFLYLASTPPIYQADALLQLEERSGRLALPESMQEFMGDSPASALTEVEILRSRMVISQVVDELDLDWRAEPALLPVLGYALTRYDVPRPDLDVLARYAGREEHIALDLLEVPATWIGSLFELTITGSGAFSLSTPDGAVHSGRVGEALAIESQGFRLRVSELTGSVGRQFTIRKISKSAAIAQVRGALSATERGRQSGVLEVRFTSHDREHGQRVLNAVLEAYVRQNVARSAIEAESSLQFIDSQLPEAERILSEAEMALTDYRQSRQSVLPEVANEVLNLTRDLELARNAYTQLLTRAQELRVVRASSVGDVRIVDAAQVGAAPIAPRSARVLALSMILGAMLGLGLIFLRNWMRRGVQNAAELEKMGLPVLATINYSTGSDYRLPRKGKAPILALRNPSDLTVEGIRSLRTGLHFGMLDAKTSTLAITSSAPGAGKSFLATNLAVVSAQAGQAICLVDADLRRGVLHRYLGISRNVPGLSDVLAGEISWEEALHEGPVPGLYILPSGRLPPNPSELLMRHTLNDLVAGLSARFQLSIFDCPPVLAVTDPVIIARATGAATIVIRHDVTPAGEIIAVQKALEAAGVRLNGAILNAFDPRRVQTGYNYDYRYSYKSQ